MIAGLSLILAGCGENSPPSTPSPPNPQPGTLTITGVVIDHTWNGPEPRDGVRIRMFSAALGWVFATTDANGEYRFSGIPPRQAVWIAATPDSEYRSPCPSGAAPLDTDKKVDVHVVSTKLLATTGPPPTMPLTSIWFSGEVFERVAGVRQPVAGATVTLNGNTSETLSDFHGRYIVCTVPPGTGTDTWQLLNVSREGFHLVGRDVFAGWDYFGADIELVRK
jgi:hypothetical protein